MSLEKAGKLRAGISHAIALGFGLISAAAEVLCCAGQVGSAISELAMPWLAFRYGTVYAGAILLGYMVNAVRMPLWLILVAPPLIIEHWLFLRQMQTVSNLWPPILFIDVMLFALCLPLMSIGKRLRGGCRKMGPDGE